ncbi:hypothetical protein BC826DRAFT_974645 [Russula brevipes]|nr:hypothetical protein BC826DRAFT_974645 [Russula brevipes]
MTLPPAYDLADAGRPQSHLLSTSRHRHNMCWSTLKPAIALTRSLRSHVLGHLRPSLRLQQPSASSVNSSLLHWTDHAQQPVKCRAEIFYYEGFYYDGLPPHTGLKLAHPAALSGDHLRDRPSRLDPAARKRNATPSTRQTPASVAFKTTAPTLAPPPARTTPRTPLTATSPSAPANLSPPTPTPQAPPRSDVGLASPP